MTKLFTSSLTIYFIHKDDKIGDRNAWARYPVKVKPWLNNAHPYQTSLFSIFLLFHLYNNSTLIKTSY